MPKKYFSVPLIASLIFALSLLSSSAIASPWAEGKTYGEKAGGKAVFGVKNLLLGWTALFTESSKYEYYMEKKKSWEGLCYGISKTVLYTATGAIHLLTFPFPVDFPNVGEGVLETSVKEQAERAQSIKASSQEISSDAMKSEVASAESKETTPPSA